MNSNIQDLVKKKLLMNCNDNTYLWFLKLCGPLNIGHLVPLFQLADVLESSASIKIVLDDSMSSNRDIVDKRMLLMKEMLANFFSKMNCNINQITFCLTSEIRNNEEYVMDFYKMISVTTESQAIQAINNKSENLKLYNLLEPILFINDIQSVCKSNVLLGEDKRSLCDLSKLILNSIHKEEMNFVLHPVIYDHKGSVMSKRNKAISINITDANNNINNKIKKYFCEEGNIKTGIFDIYEFIIFPFCKRNNQDLVIKDRDNVSTTYDSIETMKEAYGTKKIHPGDLKDSCSKYIVRILDTFFDRTPEYVKKINTVFN